MNSQTHPYPSSSPIIIIIIIMIITVLADIMTAIIIINIEPPGPEPTRTVARVCAPYGTHTSTCRRYHGSREYTHIDRGLYTGLREGKTAKAHLLDADSRDRAYETVLCPRIGYIVTGSRYRNCQLPVTCNFDGSLLLSYRINLAGRICVCVCARA